MSLIQKQRVGSLRYCLYSRPLHPELFDIFDDRRIVQPSYDAQIWVTGCTHLLGFYSRGLSLCEVIVDEQVELPQRGLLLELPLRGEKAHEQHRRDGIGFMMNFQAEHMSPAVYTRTHHDLARIGAKRGLFVPFPMWLTHGLTPFTFIDYEAKPNELHVFAFHAFPEDLTVIKTQTIFELAADENH